MKRLILILSILGLIICCSACNKNKNIPNGDIIMVDEPLISPNINSDIKDNTTEKIIYDKNNVKIYYKGIMYDGEHKAKFYIITDSNYNINAYCENIKINEYDMDSYIDISYIGNTARYLGVIKIDKGLLESNNIKDINKIEGTIHMKDKTTDKLIDTFDFIVE